MNDEAIAIEAWPELPGVASLAADVLRGDRPCETARPLLDTLDVESPQPGPAWKDAEFLSELREEHERLGAPAASRQALDALADGAACVVTGQQPGLLVGPLFSLYKVIGAVCLAREMTRRAGRRVVPVYWCGSDDSDFDEVRVAWGWDRTDGPFRVELDRALWREGQRVGDVADAAIGRAERTALERTQMPEELRGGLDALVHLDGLSDRTRAWLLRMFAGDGLVVVDARSPRLRALGAPLFENYAGRYDEITAALDVRANALDANGWGASIDDVARRSGLFLVDGDARRKLEPEQLRAGAFDATKAAPSVLLRAVWQDALLGPEVAVLGPGELRYHGLLGPVYEALGVRAARPALRPHAVLADARTWPAGSAGRRALLTGSDDAIDALRRVQLPADWDAALGSAAGNLERAVEGLEAAVSGEAAARELHRLRGRLEDALTRSRTRLADVAAVGVSPRGQAQWYNLRGQPQERAYAATQWWTWWGGRADAARRGLEAAYLESVTTGTIPAWALVRPSDA